MAFRPIESNFEDIVTYFASLLCPENYLELGISQGIRINKIVNYVNRAIGVDIVEPKQLGKYEFYCLSTDEFFNKIKNGEIQIPQFDIVFIDADHSLEQCYKDFINVLPYVANNGLVFMHDTFGVGDVGDVGSGPYDAAKRIREEGYEITTVLPVYPGMSIIRKS